MIEDKTTLPCDKHAKQTHQESDGVRVAEMSRRHDDLESFVEAVGPDGDDAEVRVECRVVGGDRERDATTHHQVSLVSEGNRKPFVVSFQMAPRAVGSVGRGVGVRLTEQVVGVSIATEAEPRDTQQIEFAGRRQLVKIDDATETMRKL